MLFFQVCLSIILLFVSSKLLKFAIRRQYYSKTIPSRTQRLVDIYGDLSLFLSNDKTAQIFQVIGGYFQLFKKESLCGIWLSYSSIVVIKEPEALEEVLKGGRNLEKAWVYDFGSSWLGTGLLTSKPDLWKQRKKIVSPAFHQDLLKNFLPTMNEKSMSLVEKLEKHAKEESTDLFETINHCSLEVICETMLGININVQENSEEYIKATKRIMAAFMERFFNPKLWFDSVFSLTKESDFEMTVKILHAFTHSVIQANKKKMKEFINNNSESKRKPLIQSLFEHQLQNKSFTDEGLREEVDIFTIAGHESVSLSLNWTFHLIGLDAEVQRKLHQEIDEVFGDEPLRPLDCDDLNQMTYLECVIKESLRLFPPVPLIGRKAEKDCEIGSYHIPKGSTFIISLYNLHRNERFFPNPEKFDPSRFLSENCDKWHPYAYVPFSAGSRNCIGQKFAIMELKLVVAFVLRKYRVESLDARDKIIPTMKVLLHPHRPIRVRIRPRNQG